MAVNPQNPFYVPPDTLVAAYKKKKQKLLSFFNTAQHPIITEKLIHSIHSTDVCQLTHMDVLHIYKNVFSIRKGRLTEHMNGINLDSYHAIPSEDDNDKISRTLFDDALTDLTKVNELLNELNLAYLTLSTSEVSLITYGMYNLFLTEDAEHLRIVLSTAVDYLIGITPAGPILSLLQAFKQYQEEIEKDKRTAKTASDFLTDLDNYISQANRWCVLSQCLANMWDYTKKGVEWDNKNLFEGATKQVTERFARLSSDATIIR